MKVGIIGFSFGLACGEPNPCNIRLAEEVNRILREELDKGNEAMVVVQWEIAKALEEYTLIPDHIVGPRKGVYLDSDMVMKEAITVFKQHGVREVIVVANPFLHLSACKTLVRKAGFKPLKRKIKRIGFCEDSLQWWTRNPVFLLVYGVRMKLTNKRG